MSKKVQFRRGTYAENEAFTGAEGEITVDTDSNSLRVHDGVTVGGFEVTGNVHFTGNEMALGESDLTITVNKDTTSEQLIINGSTNEVHLHSGNNNEALRLANNNASAYILIEPGAGNAGSKKINVRASFMDMFCNVRFQQNSQGVVFSDLSQQTTGLQNRTPASSKGEDGDLTGMFGFDDDNIYVCVADWDGTANIWKKIALNALSTW